MDAAYPLYGGMRLSPNMPLSEALGEKDGVFGAVCEATLPGRLGLEVGDRIAVGAAQYELRALIKRDPDRAVSLFSLGPRLMVSRQGLDASWLVRPDSLIR